MDMTRTNICSRDLVLACCALAACALALTCAVAAPAQAHAATATKDITLVKAHAVAKSGTLEQTTKKYDVTGDGKADSLEVVANAKSVRIYVNGSLAKKLKPSSGQPKVTVRYLRTAGKQPLLYVKYATNKAGDSPLLLMYSGGKLKKAVGTVPIAKKYLYETTDYGISDVKVKGRTVKVTYYLSTWTTGTMKATVSYKFSGGKLKRVGNVVPAKSDYSSWSVKSPWMTTWDKTVFYKAPDSKKKAFTSKFMSTKVKLTGMCIKGGKVYFRFKTKAGKTGWLAGGTDYYSTKSGTPFN